ncbi:hypothetical protein [Streptomyces sp. SID2999]|uniref:hypothetical protein n=1 Tax=Streptomyces sp. SID2999 TaxID=2690258 RepID=UPI001F16CE8A|nr:hypothetical protein [Streptomyces sp. SID2999]
MWHGSCTPSSFAPQRRLSLWPRRWSCGAGDEDAGVRADEVCGRFARTPAVASALAKLAGTDRFSENGSEPEKALATLRAADGKVEDSEKA